MTEKALPQGIELPPRDEAFRTDPYPILKGLRERAPVHHDTGLRRYVYTRHDDVRDILRDREFWSDPRKANPGTFTREFLGARSDEEPSMLLIDEPGHRRLRSLVSGSFTPGAVDKWRPRIRQVVARVLDGIDAEQFNLIGTGESLSVSLAAANRDPAAYPEPHRFDIERSDSHHQSFGGGRHLCLGAHLARAEAQEAISALLRRYPNLRHGDRGDQYHAIPSFRGMSSFRVQT